MKEEIKVAGVDPAASKPVVGVILKELNSFQLDIEVIVKWQPEMYEEGFNVLKQFGFDVFAVENTYMGKNVKTKEMLDAQRYSLLTLAKISNKKTYDVYPAEWQTAFDARKKEVRKKRAFFIFRKWLEDDEISAAFIAAKALLKHRSLQHGLEKASRG